MASSTQIQEDEPWRLTARKYRAGVDAKIPKDWLLSTDITDSLAKNSDVSVLNIPKSCGLLTEKELEITESPDAIALLEKLATGSLTSHAVTLAFCKRAAIAQQLTRCLTETLFDQALDRAKYCDEYLSREGKPIGPFHGLPISIKEPFNIKGVNSTLAFVSFIGNPPATNNSALVEILLSLGAVLYVKTNIPVTMMTADSDNNVFGRVLNPNRLTLTAGGSSGGEGALQALRGTILGVGTDIGGSIRIPAFCNGVFGFKPTARRIPYGGQTSPSRAGGAGIFPCAGPLCHSVRDAAYFMKHVLSYDPWILDETCMTAPWREVSTTGGKRPEAGPLRLGLILEDDEYPLHPPILRIVKLVVSKIEAAGHTIVDLNLPANTLSEASKTAFKIFGLDPRKTALGHIDRSGEPRIPSIAGTIHPDLRDFQPTLDHVFDLNVEMRLVAQRFRKLWVANRLDGIIMPLHATTAVPHDTYGSPPYTVLGNLLDASRSGLVANKQRLIHQQYPSFAIPYGKASKKLDADFLREVKYVPPYDADAVEGAPGAIQIMGRNMCDEETIANAQIIADILKA